MKATPVSLESLQTKNPESPLFPTPDSKIKTKRLSTKHNNSSLSPFFNPPITRRRSSSNASRPLRPLEVPQIETNDTDIKPLILPGNYKSIRIDRDQGSLKHCSLNIKEDVYLTFSDQRHYNYIGTEPNGERFVYSVLYQPQNFSPLTLRALKTTKKGSSEISLVLPSENILLPNKIMCAIQNIEKDKPLEMVKDNFKFAEQFKELEIKHPQKLTGIKVGVIFVTKGQVRPKDMFQNGLSEDSICPQYFWDWVNIMGKKIDLEGWTGYRGDMGSTGQTYWEKWNDIEFIYHIAPLMNAEGHRRLIGNDVAVIFFLEEGNDVQLDPSMLHELGTVPQIFLVIQPIQDRYRIAFFSNINIKPYTPDVPRVAKLSPDVMKNVILTKLYNGRVMSNNCPPMHRLYFTPRGETLESIISKFVNLSDKTQKTKDKSEAKNDAKEIEQSIFEGSVEILQVRVIAAQGLNQSDSSIDPYVKISLMHHRVKTKPVKNCLNPIWNVVYSFPLLPKHITVFSSISVTVMNNIKGTFLGKVIIPIKSSMNNKEDPEWYCLQKKKQDDLVSGEILLHIKVIHGEDQTNEQEKIEMINSESS